jgi:hypothetical protein
VVAARQVQNNDRRIDLRINSHIFTWSEHTTIAGSGRRRCGWWKIDDCGITIRRRRGRSRTQPAIQYGF